jgi:hypothetical protein
MVHFFKNFGIKQRYICFDIKRHIDKENNAVLFILTQDFTDETVSIGERIIGISIYLFLLIFVVVSTSFLDEMSEKFGKSEISS